MIKPLKKAVLPVAGLGTRFLPATKSMPKEMLPVVDRPLIQYALDEARAAGIEQFCLITGRGKDSLIDYFDVAYELEDTLRQRGKKESLEALYPSSIEAGSLTALRQQSPLGLGHAIWCARTFVGDDPFAILLPDDLIMAAPGCLAQMVEVYNEYGGNVVAVTEVPREKTSSYGIVDIEKDDGKLVTISGVVEKPEPEQAPSNLSIIGRYILSPEIMKYLSKMEKGAGNEVQLTDSMEKLIGQMPFHGLRYNGIRYDCGSKSGFLEAQVAFALKRPDLAPAMRKIIQKYAHEEVK
ncbi:UTP--glucose-1-phosphate uridylyltransferase GalU [Commensalibacter sp. ESL0382]|uniref:UTP--glucose-1-phosphate uridylyltransferase GalU n=1 Tax=Commensalibacter sp. ESL0382 TaxID=2676445 RepID=UPI0013B9076A|nr:UTP--glucose-1-phosphate uridylyltransferase GalU [Commensalibacter sp. ESL0382]